MATLHDISRRTGLSVTTVSHALNNRPGYSQATRRLVRLTAQELGYTANPLARGLLGKGTKTVGILWSLGRANAEGFVREIAMRMWQGGYVTFMADGMSDPSASLKILSDFDRRGVDGVVFQADRGLLSDARIVEHLKRFRAAVAVTDAMVDSPIDLVVQDISPAVGQVVEHWVADGRRNIGYMGSAMATGDEVNALREHLRRNGLSDKDIVIDAGNISGPFNHLDQYRAALERQFPIGGRAFTFDAVLCPSDDGAAAVLSWLRDRGMRVPGDVAVVGGGDMDLTRVAAVPLASIHRHYAELSDAIGGMVLRRLASPHGPPAVVSVPLTFVWRDSAGGGICGCGNEGAELLKQLRKVPDK